MKRLWAHKGMTLITIFGLTVAIALFMTVPMFSDGVNFRILEKRLATQTENQRRPPFAYLFSYIGSWHGPLQWGQAVEADTFMLDQGHRMLGLDALAVTRHLETPLYQIFVDGEIDYENDEVGLGFLQFASTTNFEENIRIVEGAWPRAVDQSERLEVLVSAPWANELGWQTGEVYIAYDHRNESPDVIQFEVAGIWEPLDPLDEYWPYAVTTFEGLLMIPEASYPGTHIAPRVDDEINLLSWYFQHGWQFTVQPQDANQLIRSLRRLERELATILARY